MGKVAILMVHGFAGGIYDFEDLANHLELNRKYDVFVYTLPGHAKNLSKSKYTEWVEKSEEKLNFLIDNGYKNIYVIGHSMGGIIASYLASKYKEVKKLVLAAPGFHYLNVKNTDIDLTDNLKLLPKLIDEYGHNEVISRFLKLNITALGEFVKLNKEYYNCPSNITCKVLLLQGLKDDLVPSSSSEYVYNTVKSKLKKLVYFKNENHNLLRDKNKEEIFSIIDKFLKHDKKGGIYNL